MEEISAHDVSKYFTFSEWNQTSSYEKLRIQNMYNNYMDMINSGFDIPKPYFMEQDYNNENDNRLNKVITDNVEKENIKPKRKCVMEIENQKSNRDCNVKAVDARYPKRNVPIKNYVEEEDIPDDRYVYCDDCMSEYVDRCNIHGYILLDDNKVPKDPKNPNRAKETVPKGWLQIKDSKIVDGGEGVWTLKRLQKGIRFGPYEGQTGYDGSDGRYCWEIKKNGKIVSHVDGFDTSMSNWMRYVNCARNKEEQNLMAFQYKGHIYYRTVEDIEQDTELLVYYGTKFAKELGIDTKNYNSPPNKPYADNVFKCENCNLVFRSPINLENHVTRCTKKCRYEKVLQERNTDSVNEGDTFECVPCSKIYGLKSLYEFHMKTKHYIYGDGLPKQSNSDSGINSSSTIDSEQKEQVRRKSKTTDETKHSARKFQCTVCGKSFTRRRHLEIHTRVHTGDRPFKCPKCDKSFTQAGDLQKHDRTHTGHRPFKCQKCDMSFTESGSLQRHDRTHTGHRPFKCQKCDMSFTQAGSLQAHARIHTGHRPFKCQKCDMSFTQAGSLKAHARIHTGVRPYKCPKCNTSFTTSSDLKVHDRIHTGVKPYVCKVCSQSFTQSSTLWNHQRTQHA